MLGTWAAAGPVVFLVNDVRLRRAERREGQAIQVSMWTVERNDLDEPTGFVRNGSQQPIYSVAVLLGAHAYGGRAFVMSDQVVPPGADAAFFWGKQRLAKVDNTTFSLRFQDAAGLWWYRDRVGGLHRGTKLPWLSADIEAIERRVTGRTIGFAVRAPVRVRVWRWLRRRNPWL